MTRAKKAVQTTCKVRAQLLANGTAVRLACASFFSNLSSVCVAADLIGLISLAAV